MNNSNTTLGKREKDWILEQLEEFGKCSFLLIAILFALFLLIGCTPQNDKLSPTEDWRLSPKYVSAEQFGKDWPFTITEGLVACVSDGGIILKTSKGNFGLTGFTNTLGYTNIKDSGLWKDAENGFTKVPLSNFTRYVVDLCQ